MRRKIERSSFLKPGKKILYFVFLASTQCEASCIISLNQLAEISQPLAVKRFVLQHQELPNRGKGLTLPDIILLMQSLLHRYYLSHTIRENLLPDLIERKRLDYMDESIDKLLTSSLRSNPKLPRLVPASAIHEDFHFFRRDLPQTLRSRYQFDEKSIIQDIPNLEIVTAISYEFHGHGDSSKTRKLFIGRRRELTEMIDLGNEATEFVAYIKTRQNEEGLAVAKTIVVKNKTKVARLRLDPKDEFNSEIFKELMLSNFEIEFTLNPRLLDPVLKTRHTVKLASNEKTPKVFGRLSLDLIDKESILHIEYDPDREDEVNLLLQDIHQFLLRLDGLT